MLLFQSTNPNLIDVTTSPEIGGLIVAFIVAVGGFIIFLINRFTKLLKSNTDNKVINDRLDTMERKVEIGAQEAVLSEFKNLRDRVSKLENEELVILKTLVDSQTNLMKTLSTENVPNRFAGVIDRLETHSNKQTDIIILEIKNGFSDLRSIITNNSNQADVIKLMSDIETRLTSHINSIRDGEK